MNPSSKSLLINNSPTPVSIDSFGTKINSEGPCVHSIPQLPQWQNSFVFLNPNEITIHSSKDNLMTNPKSKSSSNLLSMKSKSYKSRKSSKDNKSNKSNSFLSSLNQNKSKSSSFSRKSPILPNPSHPHEKTDRTQSNLQRTINRSYDHNAKSQEISIPSIYFSLNHFPLADSPVTSHKSVRSFQSMSRRKRETKTIKRNLLIFTATKEKLERDMTIDPKSTMLFSEFQGTNYQYQHFTNKQNQVLKDAVFFEEGFLKNKAKAKGFLTNLMDFLLSMSFISLKTKATKQKTKKIRIWNVILKEENLSFEMMRLVLLLFYTVWVPISFVFTINQHPIPQIIITSVTLILTSLRKQLLMNNFCRNIVSIISLDVFFILFLILFLLDTSKLIPLWSLLMISIAMYESIRISKMILSRISLNKSLELLLNCFLLFFRVFFVANLVACVWIYLGIYYKSTETTWLSNIEHFSDIGLYFRSLSASFANLTLSGLATSENLIMPTNIQENVFNCVISCLSFFFLWYNWLCFSKLMTHEAQQQQNTENLNEFERILSVYGLEFNERRSFTKELGMVLEKNREQRLFGELLRLMSPSLQENLLMRIYWPIINRMPILSRNFSKAFLVKLLHRIKIVTVAANETLFKEGEYGEQCLYYVIQGEVEFLLELENSQVKLKTLKSNDYFRELSFFSGQSEKFSAKCSTLCTLLRIDLSDFIDTLKEFPLDCEMFFAIREKINTYENMAPLYLCCEHCKSRKHQILACPYLTYNPKKTELFNNFLRSSNHLERRIFQRKPRKLHMNALFDLKHIEARISDFHDTYHDEIDKLLEVIFPPSDNENSDTGPYNDTSGTNEHRSNESKDSQYTRDAVNANTYIRASPEEFMGNPPSIFLQSPSKKSRKSMTESIFHESDEEEEDNGRKKSRTTDEKTLNELEMANYDQNEQEDDEEDEEEESDEEEEEEEEKKGSSHKPFSITNSEKGSHKESARVNTNQNMTHGHSQKGTKGRSQFSDNKTSGNEIESRMMVSEKDTFHVLQNFEKMYRVNNNVTNTLTAQQTFTTGSGKKNNNTSIVQTLTKSNSSSYPKKPPYFLIKSSSSSYNSNNNNNNNSNSNSKKTPFSDYVNQPLFAFDFDKPKEFRAFLPHNNLDSVVKKTQIDGLLREKQKRIKKMETKGGKKSFGGTNNSNVANTSLSTKKKEAAEVVEQ